jgi:hypothetical protein
MLIPLTIFCQHFAKCCNIFFRNVGTTLFSFFNIFKTKCWTNILHTKMLNPTFSLKNHQHFFLNIFFKLPSTSIQQPRIHPRRPWRLAPWTLASATLPAHRCAASSRGGQAWRARAQRRGAGGCTWRPGCKVAAAPGWPRLGAGRGGGGRWWLGFSTVGPHELLFGLLLGYIVA